MSLDDNTTHRALPLPRPDFSPENPHREEVEMLRNNLEPRRAELTAAADALAAELADAEMDARLWEAINQAIAGVGAPAHNVDYVIREMFIGQMCEPGVSREAIDRDLEDIRDRVHSEWAGPAVPAVHV